MLSLIQPNGQPSGPDPGAELINVYNSTGEVTAQTDPDGFATQFNYADMSSATGTGYVLVTDPDGNQTQYNYAGATLVSEVVGYGGSAPSTSSYGRDPNTLLIDTTTDPNDHTTTNTYDTNGNLLTSTDSLGRVKTASYNAFDEKTCASTPMAAAGCSTLIPPAAIPAGTATISPPSSAPAAFVTYRQYDTDANLIWTTQGDYNPSSGNPIQSRTSYHLYSGESVTLGSNNDSCSAPAPSVELACAAIDSDAVVTQLGYDSAGDLTSLASPDGNAGGEASKTTYGYDGDGEATSTVSPLGNLSGANAANYTTLTAYDNDAEVTSVTQGGASVLPRVTSYSYDPDGNRTGVTRSASIDLVGSASAHGSASSLSLALPAGSAPGDEVVVSTTTSPQSGSRPPLTANDLYTVAGTGSTGTAGDNSQATSSALYGPARVVTDSAGNQYIADTTNNRIQEVAATTHSQWGISMTAGDTYTIAGSATASHGTTGDGGVATSALLYAPKGVALDSSGDLFIADTTNNRVQEVAATTHTQWGISMTANDIYTIAGSASGTSGKTGDGGLSTSALLSGPAGVGLDSAGNLYVADTTNNRIQEVAVATGTQRGVSMTANDIYTIAGSSAGTSGKTGDGGAATSALLSGPKDIALDSSANLYIADTTNNRLQEVAVATGTQWGQSMTANDIYTVAGSAAGTSGKTGDGGAATSALLSGPAGVALDSAGDLYIADTTNNRIQEVATATGTQWSQSMTADDIYTVAGSAAGSAGSTGDGTLGTSALLSAPGGVGLDAAGDLFMADSSNNRLREMAGSSASRPPLTANDLYTVAGTGSTGTAGDNSQATSSALYGPARVVTDSAGNQYIADTTNNRIQEVAATTHSQWGISMTAGDTYTIAGSATASHGTTGDGGVATSALLYAPKGVALDSSGDLFIADTTNNRVQEVAATTHTQWGISMTANDIYTIAGSASGTSGKTGDGGLSTSALLSGPAGVGLDSAGNLYVADTTNNRIQEVAVATGTQRGVSMTANDIYTIAGSSAGTSGKTGDGGAATSALLSGPKDIALDSSANLYIADTTNNRLQEVAVATGTQWGQSMTANDIYTVAGSAAGTSGKTGDGGAATSALLSGPAGVALDSAGDLYIADTTNNRIQEVATATGTQWSQSMTADDIYTVAGSAAGSAGSTGDGTLGTSALLSAPGGVGLDAAGDLFMADSSNNRLREMAAPAPGSDLVNTPSGYTVVGSLDTGVTTTTVFTHTEATGDTGVTLNYANSSPQAATIAVYSDVSATQPVDASSTATTASGSTVTAPSVTTTHAGDEVVLIAGSGAQGAGARWTASSGVSSETADTSLVNAGVYLADGAGPVAPGPTGSFSGTISTSGGLTGMLLALAPAGATVTTTTAYNADDEASLVTDPDGHASLTCYDGDGNAAQTVPPTGVAVNSLTPASCPTAYPTGYTTSLASDATLTTWDAQGDKTSVISPAPAGQSGAQTTTYAYDAAGHLLTLTAPAASVGGAAQVSTYTYDAANETLSQTTAAGTGAVSTTAYCYDPNGRRSAVVPGDGNTSGLVTCSTSSPYQTSSAHQTAYSYDSLNELVAQTTPATTAAPSGATTTYSYDPAGNQLTSLDANGVTTTSTYSPQDWLTGTTYSGSSAPSVGYTYNAAGERVSMSDGTGISNYSYDPFGETTSAANGAGQTVTYAYDSLANLTSMGYPLAGASWATRSSAEYAYDPASNMTALSDFQGRSIGVANNADGLVTSMTLGTSGDTVTTAYDQTDSASSITLANGSTTLLGFSYADSPAGNVGTETDNSGSYSPAVYSYDTQSRVSSDKPGGGTQINYASDASGNATTLPTGASASYDHASELTSSTLASTTTGYTYSADGQRLKATQGATTVASGTYNGAGEITAYSNTAANMTTASYNGDGLRTSDTATPFGKGAVTQNFVWNPLASVPQVLADSTNAYLYGPTSAPIAQVNLSTGVIQYLVSDGLGSVRGVVSSVGSLSNSTAYDAWGNPETAGGVSAATSFGYAGAYTDATGLAYLIDRYYDPTTGQFLSVDPDVAVTGQPYAYVGDDPVNGVDPLGMSGDAAADEAYDLQHSCKGLYANAPGCGQHWYQSQSLAVAGVVVSAAAAATGVGAVVEGSLLLAGSSLALGAGGALLDGPQCLSGHITIACAGLVLDGAGAVAAGGSLGALALGAEGAGLFLGGFGVNVGLAGLVTDVFGALAGYSAKPTHC